MQLQDYINIALRGESLPSPENGWSGAEYELAAAVWKAATSNGGGPKSVRVVLDTLVALHPDLAQYAPGTERIILADELYRLQRVGYAMPEYPVYIPGLNVLVGPSGIGKSFLALDIAARLAMSSPVIYIAAEGLHGYASRWEAWKRHNGVSECPSMAFYSEPVDFMSAELTRAFIDEVSDRRPRLLVIDTLARCMLTGDENSTRDMGVLIANVDRIQQALGCGLLLVHHTGKSGDMRGNTSLRGAADCIMFLRHQEPGIVLENRFPAGKNKHNEELPDSRFRLLPVEIELEGESLSSAVVVPAQFVMSSPEDKLTPRQQQVLEVIAAYERGLPRPEIVRASGLSQATAYRIIAALEARG